jgi:hypothetical protein
LVFAGIALLLGVKAQCINARSAREFRTVPVAQASSTRIQAKLKRLSKEG